MDPVKILKRAWYILWSYRALWIFGLILALATAGAGGRGSNNVNYEQNRNSPPPTAQNIQEAFRDAIREMQRFLEQGIPSAHISGQAFTTFLWVIGGFVALMLIVGVIMAIARYVSETAVIRMVDDYEGSGNKMTVRQGLRLGWSNASWRLFLINLLVNLPLIAGLLVVIMATAGFVFAAAKSNTQFTPVSLLFAVGFVIFVILTTIIVTILLRLLRNFFWRICVLENASVGESLRRGLEMVRENWKNVGLMWIVMIGLGIVWGVAAIILAIVTLPVVLVTAILAALVVALPVLLLVGMFSTFLGGYLPWIAAGIFVAPLFFTLAFLPWLLLGSWQAVYTSTVWTLTYREIKALPALTPPPQVEPAGD